MIQVGDEVRDMTEAEKTQRDKDVAEMDAINQERAAKAAARQAVLNKLGLTADEANALLG